MPLMPLIQYIADLLRVKRVLDQLNALDQSTLTQREQEVWQEARQRAYAQAAFLLTSARRQRRASRWTGVVEYVESEYR